MRDLRRDAMVWLTGDTEMIDRMLERESAIASDPFGLDVHERVIVKLWSSPSPWFRTINSESSVSLNVTDLNLRVLQLELLTAVSKLPVFNGLCFRGVEFNGLPPEVMVTTPIGRRDNSNLVGSELIWNRFSSASSDFNRALPGELLYMIASKSGRRLQGYCLDEAEQEILFLPGSRFRVIEVVQESPMRIILKVAEV